MDYAIANEVLNKSAQRYARMLPNCRVVSVNWGPWAGGMVTPALKKLFDQEGVGLIALETGAEYRSGVAKRGLGGRDHGAGYGRTGPSSPSPLVGEGGGGGLESLKASPSAPTLPHKGGGGRTPPRQILPRPLNASSISPNIRCWNRTFSTVGR